MIFKIQIQDTKNHNHKDIFLTHENFTDDFNQLFTKIYNQHKQNCTNTHTRNITYITHQTIKTLKNQYGFNDIDNSINTTITIDKL